MIVIEREASEKISIELHRQMKTDKQGSTPDEENKPEQRAQAHTV